MQQDGPRRKLEDLHRLPRADLRSLNRTIREEHSRLAADRTRWNKLKDYFNVRWFKWIATYLENRIGGMPDLPQLEGQSGVFSLGTSADAPSGEPEDRPRPRPVSVFSRIGGRELLRQPR